MPDSRLRRIAATSALAFLIQLSTSGAQVLQSPTGNAMVNHYPGHTGIDVTASVDEAVHSPISGEFVGVVTDVLGGSKWRGVIIEGGGQDLGATVRILGLASELQVGSTVKAGDSLGTALDAGNVYAGVAPYIHLEAYEGGMRIDPAPLAEKAWPNRKAFDAAAEDVDPEWKAMREFASASSDGEAIAALEAVLARPTWESANFEVYHRLANRHAQVGGFARATALQKELIRRMELKLICAEGNMPPPALGVTAACKSKVSLSILLGKMQDNLASFEAEEQPFFLVFRGRYFEFGWI